MTPERMAERGTLERSRGQAGTASITVGEPPKVRGDALARLHTAEITVGGWTLRWAGDSWTVGQWRQHKNRTKWVHSSWHGSLDWALRKLLDRGIEGDVTDAQEMEVRLLQTYEEIVRALQRLCQDG